MDGIVIVAALEVGDDLVEFTDLGVHDAKIGYEADLVYIERAAFKV